MANRWCISNATFISLEVVMKMRGRKAVSVMVCLVLALVMAPAAGYGQKAEQSAVVMTLKEKKYSAVVTMNRGQLAELARQSGISLMKTPKNMTSTQMAFPVPSALGGGFLIAEPGALADGLNATGLTTKATAAGIVGATVAGGRVTRGADVSAARVATGVRTGTVLLEVLIAAGIIGGVIAAASGGGDTTTNH